MFDQVIGVNVKGVFLGLKHVLPVMIKQKSGSIVNTASVAGLVGTPGISPYVASKHAVIGLTKAVSGEVARSGIRINAVCPGPIDTRMIHSLEQQINPGDPSSVAARYQGALPIGRYGTADEVANVVLFLCSDLASNITGAQYVVDGGRTATGGSVTAGSEVVVIPAPLASEASRAEIGRDQYAFLIRAWIPAYSRERAIAHSRRRDDVTRWLRHGT